MKKSQLFFTTLLVPIDFIMLIVAGITAYRFRIDSFITEIIPVIYTIEFKTYLNYLILSAFVWIIIFALIGLYQVKSNRKLSQELGKIFVGTSIGLLVIVFAIFLQRELFSSRFIILVAWILSIIFVFIGRLFVLYIQRQFFKRGYGAIKIIIIGNDKRTQVIISEINSNPSHGFKIIKNYNDFNQTTINKIIDLNKKYFLDEIIVADPNVDKLTKLKIIDFTEEYHLGFRYAADLFNAVSSNAKIEPIAGIPIIEIRKTKLEGWGRIFKRSFDIFASLLFIILTSPILIITSLLVKLTSKGPIIFKNERVGQYGIKFDTLKFRSMKSEYSIGKQFKNTKKALEFEQELINKQNTRTEGPLYKIQNDPRLTSIGSFIRRYSIDELPQFINVLKGDMSIVGPRPHQPREVAQYEKYQKRLLTIKPGITGMSQVSGRSDLSFNDEVKLDLYYIENWSPWTDLQVMLKTPIAILKQRKVY